MSSSKSKDKIINRKCAMMSACMGFLMGAVFTIINQMKQTGNIQALGLGLGIVTSVVVSTLWGMIPIFNMKKLCDKFLVYKLKLDTFNPKKKILYYIGEAIIGTCIFTPINMFFNQTLGMWLGMKMGNTFPPFADTFVKQIQFLFTSGIFVKAYIASLLPSLFIGAILSLVGTALFGKLTDKICGIA